MASTDPLDGVRVLEFAHLYPGPYAGLVLQSLGADVVKVEAPGGDPTRMVPPFVEGSGGGAGAIFCALNRSKRSVELDLKDTEDRQAYLELAATADVVIDGFRPGVAERLGVGFDDLAEGREDLVYVRVSGFGPEGEMAGEPGHDVTYQAWAGTMDPEDPHLPNLPTADASSALWAACLALAHVQAGGCHKLEPSLTGSLAAPALIQDAIAAAGGPENPLTGAHPGYNVYECAEGEPLAVGALEPHFFQRLCEAVERPDVVGLWDPVARDDPAKAQAELAETFAKRSREDWLEKLQDAGVPAAPIRSVQQALEQPLDIASLDPPGVEGPEDLEGAPALGEHNEDVLGEL